MARPGSAATTGRGKRSAADASFSASSMTSASASTSPETDGMAWPLPMFSSVRMTPCRARTSAQADHPANRLAVEVRLADLRADMAGQAHQIEDGVCEQALHGVGGMVTAEGGGHRVVAVDVDAQALLTGPSRHHGGQQRPAGVDDVRPAQRLAVAAGATPGSPLRRRRRSGCEIRLRCRPALHRPHGAGRRGRSAASPARPRDRTAGKPRDGRTQDVQQGHDIHGARADRRVPLSLRSVDEAGPDFDDVGRP